MLIVGLYADKSVGIIMGILLGILLDLNSGRVIGITSILFVLNIIFAKILDRNFTKDNRMTIMCMVALDTLLFETLLYFFYIIKLFGKLEIMPFIKILCVEIVFNILITIIIYPLIQKLGKYLENCFNKKNNITKYI